MTIPPSKYKNKYRVPSSRLKEWDYAAQGYYFVTICTKDHIPWFGEIKGDQMILSSAGELVDRELQKTTKIRPNISIDTWVIMPNHIHAIIVIGEHPAESVETPRRGVSTQTQLKPGSLGAIINQYKSACTKHIHQMGNEAFAWQTRFYDHIIRNEKSLENIRAYILGNPIKWTDDEYFPNL